MTDNEIIKALECCANATHKDCKNCPLFVVDGCVKTMSTNALDLINRQQAEIERLKECPKCIYEYDGNTTEYCIQGPCSNFKTVEQIKSEAIKEFADRLKEKAHTQPIFDTYCGNKYVGDVSKVYVADIDNLVKEMVGEE